MGALVGVREVGSQHGVDLDAAESPAARSERMTRALRVMHDQGRGRGKNVTESFLLRGAEFDGIDDECVAAGC